MIDVIGVLAFFGLAALVWGAMLRRRVYQQTQIIRRSMEEESERARRQAALEKQRSRVLEAINSLLPLEEVLRMITYLISEQMNGLECWCELAVSGTPPEAGENSELLPRRDILSRTGERLGSLVLAWKSEHWQQYSLHSEILDVGVSLAALAIDNRRHYDGLVHRSEYDQLTGVPNRFFLESSLRSAFANAECNKHSFALIYIDLDRFKPINDRYGHHIGDQYLQNVARRLSEKLRCQDTLARVGGDEFIVLIPVVVDRCEAEEIGRRLMQCFDSPFRLDGNTIYGSASIGIAVYPEDGIDENQLEQIADRAMYARKQQSQNGHSGSAYEPVI